MSQSNDMSNQIHTEKIGARKIGDAAQFGRVAVVMGGSSAEREVSLDSGRGVLAALKARGVDAHAIDGIPALLDAVRAGHFARVFNILHGAGGENGELQGALQ
jgi:D-alanine-D-alanine ligase